MVSSSIVAALALFATGSFAQLNLMRATIPGAIHQCEDTSVVFFQSGGARPLQLVFLPSSQVPAGMRSGAVTLAQVAAIEPLLVVPGITAADNAAQSFEMGVAQGQVIEAFGFLPDGTGKALSLTRTIMTPLPGATNCVANAVKTIDGYGGAAAAPASTPTSTAVPVAVTTPTVIVAPSVMSTIPSASVAAFSTPTQAATTSSAAPSAAGVSVGTSGTNGAASMTAGSLAIAAAVAAFAYAF